MKSFIPKFCLNIDLYDAVEIEDERIQKAESYFSDLRPLRNFRGNYGVPRLKNKKVIKGFFYSNAEESKILEKLHNEYINEISKFIPTIKTTTFRYDKLMYLQQRFVNNCTFEQLLLDPNILVYRKIESFKVILSLSLNLIIKSNKIIGIDSKPENWIYKNKTWTLLDTFPPLLIDKDNTFKQIFNLRVFEKQFANNPNNTFFRNLAKITRRLWLKCEHLDNSINYRNLILYTLKQLTLPKSLYKRIITL